MKKQVFSLLVNNNTGLLSRVAGLFSRRGYNIDSITSGTTMDKSRTRITVVATGDVQILSQIEKQLAKLEDVIDIKILKDGESVCRELIMLKVKANAAQRAEIVAVADIFRAKIVDVETESLMLEMTGNLSKVEAFLNLMSGYEILELARTGITGLSRGADGVFDTEA
ncbi:MAG: acetolactate synthase small subunit [Tyzzerella sp.]|nr:acetolactate synthase small subunit [Tyzzerella sp.]